MKDPLCKRRGQRVRHAERAVFLINTAYNVQGGQKDAKRTLAHARALPVSAPKQPYDLSANNLPGHSCWLMSDMSVEHDTGFVLQRSYAAKQSKVLFYTEIAQSCHSCLCFV